MNKKKFTKLLALYLPYLVIGLAATNLGEAWRLAEGKELGDKIVSLIDTLPAAFVTQLPSLHPLDILVGICCGAGLRLAVYLKSKNAKKYRNGMEYGSARWGTPKDIEPFMAPKFEDNIILTKTERLMEKKGIATEKGELNRNIQKANRLIREIRAQIGKLKEWIGELFKARETAPEQPPQSPGLANLLMKYLSVQREKSRKYSQSWQRQHAADELKTIAAAVNYLSEHGISNLDELDASLSSVSDRAYSIREGMKTAEERMKKLQKLIEYGKNYTEYKPIHDELKKLQNGWTNKRDKYEEAHRAELALWDAANRYLHANLPKGTKTLPIAEWEQEYADLKTQRDSDYTKLKDTRTNVSELQKIRKCVDIALRADQPAQTQSRTKRQEQER